MSLVYQRSPSLLWRADHEGFAAASPASVIPTRVAKSSKRVVP
jgi:hypothetical protein